jgi:hypothetical protein
MGRSLWALVPVLLVVAGSSTARADFVVNGSFEAVQIGAPFDSGNPADVPGWTHSGSGGDALLWAIGYVDGGGSVTVAGDGRQFVTLGSGFNQPPAFAAWSQTMTGLTAGDSYLLRFKMAAEGDDSGPQSLTAGFTSGSSTGPQNFFAVNGANYWRNWIPESMTFLATSSSVTLQFSVNQSFDVGIDAVSVVQSVPEPSTLAILGGLVVSAVPFALRRSRRSAA